LLRNQVTTFVVTLSLYTTCLVEVY